MKKKSKNNNKNRGQEEMVGFALILILVAIVFIVFISIYIKKPITMVEDYEVNSFVQALMQYTTQCQEADMENLTIQKLIGKCQDKNLCYYKEMDPCIMLNNTIKDIVKESWNVKPGSPIKGYAFIINISKGEDLPEERFLNITNGVVTNNYKPGFQPFGNPNGENVIILLKVYS